MTAAELAAAIRKDPKALAAAREGSNSILMGILDDTLGAAAFAIGSEELNAALLLIEDSHLSRYMRDEFVDRVTDQLYRKAEEAAHAPGAQAEAQRSNAARVRAGTFGQKVGGANG